MSPPTGWMYRPRHWRARRQPTGRSQRSPSRMAVASRDRPCPSFRHAPMTDWTDKLSQRERIQAVVETLNGPTDIKEIAEEADVPVTDAKSILEGISGDDGIALRVGDKYDIDLAAMERRLRPDLTLCNDCGLPLEPDDTVYTAEWTRYEGTDKPSGAGSVRYCADCAPPGMLSGHE